MKRTLRARSRLAVSAAALAIAASLMVTAAPTARADSGIGAIVGGVGQISSYVGFARSAYDLFNQYIRGQKPPADLNDIQTAIIASQAVIVNQVDGLASAQVASCADQSIIRFEDIDKLDSAGQIALADFVTGCVTDAKNDIPVEVDRGAIDQLGLALNTVGPIALFTRAAAGLSTDILRQELITANQSLMTALQPTCAASVLAPADLPNFGQGPVTGHGA